MKFFQLSLLIIILISCNNKKSIRELHEEFSPMKSPSFRRVIIMPKHLIEKDTFRQGEFFEAMIFPNENIEMLKEIALESNLNFEMEFDADAQTRNKSLMVFHEPGSDTAKIRFEIFASDTLNKFQEVEWQYSIKFKFLENQVSVYDTTFTRASIYIIEK